MASKLAERKNSSRMNKVWKWSQEALKQNGLEFRGLNLLERGQVAGIIDYLEFEVVGANETTGTTYTATARAHFQWDDKLNQDVTFQFKADGVPTCPYCKYESDSHDPKVLCSKCRATFGHSTIEEL
jgi:hypothetical protein